MEKYQETTPAAAMSQRAADQWKGAAERGRPLWQTVDVEVAVRGAVADAILTVSITEPAELLLPGCVPHVEHDLAVVGAELERVHLDTERGCDGSV